MNKHFDIQPPVSICHSAVRLSDLLKLPSMANACVYEDVAGGIFGDVDSNPLWQGFRDIGNIPLVICRGDRAVAIADCDIRNYPIGQEPKKPWEIYLQELPFLDFSDLWSEYDILEWDKKDYIKYLEMTGCFDWLDYSDPEEGLEPPLDDPSFLEALSENLSWYRERPVALTPDNLEEHLGKYDISDICFCYEDYVRRMLEDANTQLENANGSGCAFEALSLQEAFQTLGIDGKVLTDPEERDALLTDRGLLDNKKITRFGRQCGLMWKSTLDESGGLLRELCVHKSALELFCQAVDYPRSRKVRDDGGGTLQARLERLKNFMPSAVDTQEVIWSQDLAIFRKALNMSVSQFLENDSNGPKFYKKLCDLLNLNDWLRSQGCQEGEQMEKQREELTFIELFHLFYIRICKYSLARYDGIHLHTQLIRQLGQLSGWLRMELRPETDLKEIGEISLEQRLNAMQTWHWPIFDMSVAGYLQCAAMESHSSFPLWFAQEAGLMEILRKYEIDGTQPVWRVLSRLVQNIDDCAMMLFAFLPGMLADVPVTRKIKTELK